MKKILVTGAGGQLGSEINFLSSSHPTFAFTFVDRDALDITDDDAVNQFLSNGKYYALINCAAYTAVDKAETEKELAYKINAEGSGILAEATKTNACKYIHISTDFIFDGIQYVPLSEDEKPNPLSIYGASKLAGEQLVLQNNPDTLLIRTSWVYSSFGNNFVKTILKLCKERESLNIIFDQVGTPTYARDLAATVLQILEQEKWQAGVYNYSNEGVASWYDFAIAIRDIAGLKTKISPIETTQYPTPAVRPKYSVLNKKKIKETFGIEIPYWRKSLEEMLNHLKG